VIVIFADAALTTTNVHILTWFVLFPGVRDGADRLCGHRRSRREDREPREPQVPALNPRALTRQSFADPDRARQAAGLLPP
jgi:hypothetical protein